MGELTDKDFDKIYDHTKQDMVAKELSFGQQLEAEDINDVDSDLEESDDAKKDTLNATIQEIKEYDNKFVLDGLGYQNMTRKDHLLLYVGDCRVNPAENEEMNEEEEKKQNVEAVTAKINGWPRVFYVTKRTIEPNES